MERGHLDPAARGGLEIEGVSSPFSAQVRWSNAGRTQDICLR